MRKDSRNWMAFVAANPGRVTGLPAQEPAGTMATSSPVAEVDLTLARVCSQLGLLLHQASVRVDVRIVGPSLNKFYESMPWQRRKDLADAWHTATYRALIRSKQVPIIAPHSALLVCTFGPGREVQDGVNLAPTCKMMEDALVHCSILPDDTHEWVTHHTLVGRPGAFDRSTLLYFPSKSR